MKNKYVAFCDVETTGFSTTKNDVIQMCFIITDENYKIISSFDQYCRPDNFDCWNDEIHGIKLEQAMKFQSRRKMLIKFLHFIKEFKHKDDLPLTFISHSKNGFDFNFVLNAFIKELLHNSFFKVFSKSNQESTVMLADKFKSVFGLPNSKLNTLAEYFDIELDHHEAMSDTYCCLQIFRKLKGLEQKRLL